MSLSGQTVPLAELCTAIVDCEHKTAPLADSGHPSIRTTDIKNGRIDFEGANRVDEPTYIEWTKRMRPRPGDLILAREAPVGEVGIIPDGREPCLGQRTVLLRPDASRVVPRYLLYSLISPQMRHQMTSRAEGCTVPHLNVADVRDLPVPIPPPLLEQEQIARALGALDDRIELNRRMNRTLESIARAIFKSWFVDFDPVRKKMEGGEVGLPPDLAALFPASLATSDLGRLPQGWTVRTLGEVLEIVDCLHSKKPERRREGPTLLQLGNIGDDGLLDIGDIFHISETDYARWASRLEAREGDCVITNVGRVGAVAQIPLGVRAALGRNMTGLRCTPAFPYPTFLVYLLRSSAMRAEIESKTDVGTILEALNVRNIPRLRFVHPPEPLLQRFESVVRPLEARREACVMESRRLATLRDQLLPHLITNGVTASVEASVS
jgi:type I restriction enzyme S subunit